MCFCRLQQQAKGNDEEKKVNFIKNVCRYQYLQLVTVVNRHQIHKMKRMWGNVTT